MKNRFLPLLILIFTCLAYATTEWGNLSVKGNMSTTGTLTQTGVATFTAAPVFSALTATTVPYLDASKNLTSSAVTPTELGLLSGKTSLMTNPMDGAGQLVYGGASGTPTKLAAGTSSQVLRSGGAGAPTWSDVVKSTLSCTSGSKAPGGSSRYQDHSSNSITLTAGTWLLIGQGKFTSSPTAGYTTIAVGWFGGDGADNSTPPSALSGVSGLSIITTHAADMTLVGGVSAQDTWLQAPITVVTCSSSCVIYLTTYAAMATHGNATITVAGSAIQLQ